MPRVQSKTASPPATAPYQYDYQYDPQPQQQSTQAKKKHICSQCERGFTTSGHLARHSRVHTGERNHKCPFPGCETRCSRQDNLQQHYRIHLAPGSRRNSSRSNVSRVMKRSSSLPDEHPPMSPPPLEPARLYSQPSPPPDSPPPLVQATLPATVSSRSSSSPDTPFSPITTMPHYSYRGPSNYSQGETQSHVYSYSSSAPYSGQDHHPVHNSNPPSPISAGSRHSISHISPPQSSYNGPPSPGSAHSMSPHQSSPPTPTYPYSHGGFHGHETSSYQNSHTMSEHHSMSNSQLVHAGYSSAAPMHSISTRSLSPPPILAPITSISRVIQRREDRSPHAYQPQPVHGDHYYGSLAGFNAHGAWKPDSGLRSKSIGALVQ